MKKTYQDYLNEYSETVNRNKSPNSNIVTPELWIMFKWSRDVGFEP